LAWYRSTAREHRSSSTLEPDATAHTSNAIKLLMDWLGQRPETQLLDIGPVCGENIEFFGRRVGRLFICDMFLQLHKDRKNGLPPDDLWRHLHYPSQSFDGILLWELTQRLEEGQLPTLVERNHMLLRPGGMVLVMMGDHAVSETVNAFVTEGDFKVHLRPQPHLDLPVSGRQSRDVLAVMSPFSLVKSFIYRNGLREFLFQRN
jgi:hypothetical protein